MSTQIDIRECQGGDHEVVPGFDLLPGYVYIYVFVDYMIESEPNKEALILDQNCTRLVKGYFKKND